MSLNEKKNYILNELKKNGYRITTQRKVLIDIILEDECSCCKEIYYRASKKGWIDWHGNRLSNGKKLWKSQG